MSEAIETYPPRSCSPVIPCLLPVHAPFSHPALGDMWITRVTPTHISFEMLVGPRRFGRFKYSHAEFISGKENAHALAEERSDDSRQRVVGGKVDR
jgi:hypothetical protein